MKKLLSLLLALVLIFAVPGCGSGGAEADESVEAAETTLVTTEPATEAPPANGWEFDTPENHGMDGALLARFHEAIGTTDVTSIVIVKNGYIVDEYYKGEFDEDSVFRFNSCTKSFTSALIGIAVEEGLIRGIDTRIAEYFPQIDESGSAYQKEITIRHLLEHTAGMDWPEWGGSIWRPFVSAENWVDFILARPMAARPGAVFNYSTGGSHLLAAILEQACGTTARDYMFERLLDPLGIESAELRADPQGVMDGGNGLSMTARDAAKFGQLYLERGMWRGRQIVPEAWVAQSTKRHSAGYASFGQYGYQWWVKTFGEYSAYFAQGHGGQYIIVVPALELVTVMTSRAGTNGAAPQRYFSDYVLAACG